MRLSSTPESRLAPQYRWRGLLALVVPLLVILATGGMPDDKNKGRLKEMQEEIIKVYKLKRK